MRATRRGACIGLILLVAIAGPVNADDRSWLKQHLRVEPTGSMLAEYTLIGTKDGASPQLSRVLYQDAQGARLVIRYTTTFSDGGGIPQVVTSSTIVSTVDGSQSITIAVDAADAVTLTYGATVITYPDAEHAPAEAKQAGAALVSVIPQPFRTTLSRLALLGSYHSTQFEGIGFVFRELLYPNIQPIGPVAEAATDPTEVITDFDPNTTPPGPFEQPFGQAYFQ